MKIKLDHLVTKRKKYYLILKFFCNLQLYKISTKFYELFQNNFEIRWNAVRTKLNSQIQLKTKYFSQ